MERFIIYGGKKLEGKLKVPTAKNSLLPILAGCLVVKGKVIIKGYESFTDCEAMLDILRSLGAQIHKISKSTVSIDCGDIDKATIETELALKLRASIFTLGALLNRNKLVKMAYPGGCLIGNRPIDQHLKGLRSFGVKIVEKNGYLYCNSDGLKAGEFCLDVQSVGATYNLILATVCQKGVSVIYNPAKEPEIVDFQNFLNKCGAKISGAGTDKITIEGVGGLLRPCEYRPIGDRIIAGTYLIAVASTGGKLSVTNINPDFLTPLLYGMRQAGCIVKTNKNTISLKSEGVLNSFQKIETMPFPSFPTDLQAPIMAMQTISNGTCVLVENLFEARFKQVAELKRMGANIMVYGKVAIIQGVDKLYGAEVCVSDLRAGASLVIAGLVAEGYTTINDIYHIDRGYIHIEKQLQKLGANIIREKI